jgi:O-antigen/teichoic acid export membrane protein
MEQAANYVRTMSPSLDRELIGGVAWTVGVKWSTQILSWATTILVAHILRPSDYGLVAMATIYVNFLTLFSEFGLGTAVVNLNLSSEQISQLNSLSVFLGLAGFLLCAAAAPLLGHFFHAPGLPSVILVLSMGFIASGFRVVPYALLEKDLRFRRLATIEGVQCATQAIVTLTLALLGLRFWALVFGILSFVITPTAVTLLTQRYSFSFPRLTSLSGVLSYSRDVLISRLFWALYNDADFVIAGRTLGPGPLGAYSLAWTFAHVPLDKLTTLVARVAPPIFSRVQADSEALCRYVKQISGVMALIIFPLTIGTALVAREFVPLVLGSKWTSAIVPLELLALYAAIRSSVQLLTPVLNVLGETRLLMWTSIVGALVLPTSFYLCSRWGAPGIAAVWIGIYPLIQIPTFLRIFRRIKLPATEYFGVIWPALSACGLMAVAVLSFRFTVGEAPAVYMRLAAEIAIGAIVYTGSLLTFHKGYIRSIWEFSRTFRSERKGSSP